MYKPKLPKSAPQSWNCESSGGPSSKLYIYILESSGRALRRGLDSFLSPARQRISAWRLCKCNGRYACGFTIAAPCRLKLTAEACGASGGSGLQDQDRSGDSRVSCWERKKPIKVARAWRQEEAVKTVSFLRDPDPRNTRFCRSWGSEKASLVTQKHLWAAAGLPSGHWNEQRKSRY